MPSIKIINDQSDIKLSNKWAPATKFNCKDKIVNSKGRKYQIIQKYERAFSTCENVKRVFLWILVICSLGLALISKSVLDLLRKKTKTIRFAVPALVRNDPPAILPNFDQIQDVAALTNALEVLSNQRIDKTKAELEKLNGNALEKLLFLSEKSHELTSPLGLKDAGEILHKKENEDLYYQLAVSTLMKQAPLYAAVIEQGCNEGVFQTAYPLESAEFLLNGIFNLISSCRYPWNEEDVARRVKAFPKMAELLLQAPPKSLHSVVDQWIKIWNQETSRAQVANANEEEEHMQTVLQDIEQLKRKLNDHKGNATEKLLFLHTAAGKLIFALNENEFSKMIHKKENKGLHDRLHISVLSNLAPLYAAVIEQGCNEGIFEAEHPLESVELIFISLKTLSLKCIYPWKEEDINRRKQAFGAMIDQVFQAKPGFFNLLINLTGNL